LFCAASQHLALRMDRSKSFRIVLSCYQDDSGGPFLRLNCICVRLDHRAHCLAQRRETSRLELPRIVPSYSDSKLQTRNVLFRIVLGIVTNGHEIERGLMLAHIESVVTFQHHGIVTVSTAVPVAADSPARPPSSGAFPTWSAKHGFVDDGCR
jgi:hypothetical protein